MNIGCCLHVYLLVGISAHVQEWWGPEGGRTVCASLTNIVFITNTDVDFFYTEAIKNLYFVVLAQTFANLFYRQIIHHQKIKTVEH